MKNICLILLLAGFMSTSMAQSRLSADEAEDIVLDRYGGKILETSRDKLDDRNVYIVRVLIKGKKVRIYHVDVESGKLVY